MIEVTKVQVDMSGVEGTVDNLLDPVTMLQIQSEFADVIDPWTPFLTGQLHSDVTITDEGVTYNSSYAADKYYGEVFCKDYHPLATSHWDKVAMETQLPLMIEKVKEILTARAKELYG